MACPLIPDCVFESIYALSPDVLRRMGVRLVLCDLDNTLAPYEESAPSPALLAWKAELEQSGITLFVVSNSRKSRRCPDFCAALGVPFVHHAGKPSRYGGRPDLHRYLGGQPGRDPRSSGQAHGLGKKSPAPGAVRPGGPLTSGKPEPASGKSR